MSALDPFALGGASDGADIAAVEFEPIDNAGIIAALLEPAWSRSTQWLGVYLRVAAHVVGKTKVELGEVARSLDEKDLLFDTLDNLEGAEKKLEGLAQLARAASARLLIAASLAAVEDQDAVP